MSDPKKRVWEGFVVQPNPGVFVPGFTCADAGLARDLAKAYGKQHNQPRPPVARIRIEILDIIED